MYKVVPSANPRRARRATAVAFALVAIQAAVAPPPAEAGTVRHDRDPQAYLNLGASPAYASVGRLDVSRGDPVFAGSGTLVADRWVLTAAHLLENASSMKFTVGGVEYRAAGWVAHSKHKGDVRRGYDLGLVKLEQAVQGVAPVLRYRGSKERGQTATFVGFGLTGNGLEGANLLDFSTLDGQKRAGTNVVDDTKRRKETSEAARRRLPRTSRVFYADFDNPTNPADNATASASPTDLEFLISVGDSGGGAFIDRGTGLGPELIGVHSFGEFFDGEDDSDYGDATGHVRVSKFKSWINSTIKKGDKDPSRLRGFVFANPGEVGSGLPPTPADMAARMAGPLPPDFYADGATFTDAAVVPEPAGAGVLLAASSAGVLRRRRPAR